MNGFVPDVSQQPAREAAAQVRRGAAQRAGRAEEGARGQGAPVARAGPGARREVRARAEPLCKYYTLRHAALLTVLLLTYPFGLVLSES